MDDRDEKGRFPKGVSGNPQGRPPKARELAYLAVIQEVVTLQDWRSIVAKAKRDALGVLVVETATGQQVMDDPFSDGTTREKGRRFIAEYIIGKPKQPLAISDDLADLLGDLDAEQRAALIAECQTLVAGVESACGKTDTDADRATTGVG